MNVDLETHVQRLTGDTTEQASIDFMVKRGYHMLRDGDWCWSPPDHVKNIFEMDGKELIVMSWLMSKYEHGVVIFPTPTGEINPWILTQSEMRKVARALMIKGFIFGTCVASIIYSVVFWYISR